MKGSTAPLLQRGKRVSKKPSIWVRVRFRVRILYCREAKESPKILQHNTQREFKNYEWTTHKGSLRITSLRITSGARCRVGASLYYQKRKEERERKKTRRVGGKGA